MNSTTTSNIINQKVVTQSKVQQAQKAAALRSTASYRDGLNKEQSIDQSQESLQGNVGVGVGLLESQETRKQSNTSMIWRDQYDSNNDKKTMNMMMRKPHQRQISQTKLYLQKSGTNFRKTYDQSTTTLEDPIGASEQAIRDNSNCDSTANRSFAGLKTHQQSTPFDLQNKTSTNPLQTAFQRSERNLLNNKPSNQNHNHHHVDDDKTVDYVKNHTGEAGIICTPSEPGIQSGRQSSGKDYHQFNLGAISNDNLNNRNGNNISRLDNNSGGAVTAAPGVDEPTVVIPQPNPDTSKQQNNVPQKAQTMQHTPILKQERVVTPSSSRRTGRDGLIHFDNDVDDDYADQGLLKHPKLIPSTHQQKHTPHSNFDPTPTGTGTVIFNNGKSNNSNNSPQPTASNKNSTSIQYQAMKVIDQKQQSVDDKQARMKMKLLALAQLKIEKELRRRRRLLEDSAATAVAARYHHQNYSSSPVTAARWPQKENDTAVSTVVAAGGGGGGCATTGYQSSTNHTNTAIRFNQNTTKNVNEAESNKSSLEQVRADNQRRQRMTMSMLDGPSALRKNDPVMDSTLQWKERPYRWRREQSEKEIVADYHQRYSVDDAKRTGLVAKTAQMGPFYEKYIQKMGQMYVKDRVKRLKQTFEVAKRGHRVKIKTLQNHSQQEQSIDLTLNSSIYSSNPNQALRPQVENSEVSSEPSRHRSSSNSPPPPIHLSSKLTTSKETSQNDSKMMLLLQAAKKQQQKEQLDEKSSMDVTHFFNTSFSRLGGSPLMRKSGFDLRQRLGRGDRTFDQMFSMMAADYSNNADAQHQSIEYQEVKLPLDQHHSNVTLLQTSSKNLLTKNNQAYQTLQRGSIDTMEDGTTPLNISKSKDNGLVDDENVRKDQQQDDQGQIQVNLPDSRHSRKRRSEYHTIENINVNGCNTVKQQNQVADGKHQAQTTKQQNSKLALAREQSSLENILPLQKQGTQQVSQQSLYQIQHPHVSVKGVRSSSQQSRFNTKGGKGQIIIDHSNASKLLNEMSDQYDVDYNSGTNHRASVLQKFNKGHNATFFVGGARGKQQRNEDLGGELKLPTPNTHAIRIGQQHKQREWHRKDVIQDRLPVKNYKLGTHRNTLQKHVWKQPGVTSETGEQLVEETLKDFYNDPIAKDLHSKTTGQFKRMPPIDMAVLQQKAFQQFDLIMDAEMDIQRQILTKDQIPFGKDMVTPKAQKRFQYSNIMPKKKLIAKQLQHEKSQLDQHNKSIMSSSIPSSSLMMDMQSLHANSTMHNVGRDRGSIDIGNNQMNHSVAELSNFHSKQLHQQRKICKSCLDRNPINSSINVANNSSEFQIRNSQPQDRQLEDWLHGNYHVKLTSNLIITQDYDIAAGRSRRDFQSNYHEDGRKKSQNLQYLTQKIGLPIRPNDERRVAVIDTGLRQQQQSSKREQNSKQMNVDIMVKSAGAWSSHVSEMSGGKSETELQQTVRRMAQRFKQMEEESHEETQSQQSSSILKLNDAIPQPSVSTQGGIVVGDPSGERKYSNQLSTVSKEINIRMSLSKTAAKVLNMNETANTTQGLFDDDLMTKTAVKVTSPDKNEEGTGEDQENLKSTVPVTGTNQQQTAGGGLYSIEQKISFLEPEISKQLEQKEAARQYQEQIGIFDEPLKSSARRKQQSNAFKSSNFAGGSTANNQLQMIKQSEQQEYSVEAIQALTESNAKWVQTSVIPQTSSVLHSQCITASLKSGATQKDFKSDEGQMAANQRTSSQDKSKTDKIVQATINTSDYTGIEPIQQQQMQQFLKEDYKYSDQLLQPQTASFKSSRGHGPTGGTAEADIKSSQMSNDTQAQIINGPMYDETKNSNYQVNEKLSKIRGAATKSRFQPLPQNQKQISTASRVLEQANKQLSRQQSNQSSSQHQNSPSRIVVPQASRLLDAAQMLQQTDKDGGDFSSLVAKQGIHTSSIESAAARSRGDPVITENKNDLTQPVFNMQMMMGVKNTNQLEHSPLSQSRQKQQLDYQTHQTSQYQGQSFSGLRKQSRRHSNKNQSSSQWKSPFQAHQERSEAQKQMLKYMVRSQPSEMHKLTERSDEIQQNMQQQKQQQKQTTPTLVMNGEASPTMKNRIIQQQKSTGEDNQYRLSKSKFKSSGSQSPPMGNDQQYQSPPKVAPFAQVVDQRRAETGTMNSRASYKNHNLNNMQINYQQSENYKNYNSNGEEDGSIQNKMSTQMNPRGETAGAGPSTPGTYSIAANNKASQMVIQNDKVDVGSQHYSEAPAKGSQFSRNQQVKQHSLSSGISRRSPAGEQNQSYHQLDYNLHQASDKQESGNNPATNDVKNAESGGNLKEPIAINNTQGNKVGLSKNSLMLSSSFDKSSTGMHHKGLENENDGNSNMPYKNRYSHHGEAQYDGPQQDEDRPESARRNQTPNEAINDEEQQPENANTQQSAPIEKPRVVGVTRKTVKEKK